MSSRDEKIKIQAGHCLSGKVLDVGFSANPNTFLEDVVGIDIKLPEEKPETEMLTDDTALTLGMKEIIIITITKIDKLFLIINN